MSEKKFEFYNKNEIKKLLLNEERLVYADNGIDEVVVRYKDLPDFIVDMSRSMGHRCNLKVYKYPVETMTPILTTIGEFLDKCDPDVRADIIERLIKVQTEEDTKNYKIIDEYALEEAREEIRDNLKIKIINLSKTDFGYIRCNALITINERDKLNIVEYFDADDYENWKNSRKEIKEEIAYSWEEYFYLPKISECSKLMQKLYDEINKGKIWEVDLEFDNWNKDYTFEDLDKLVEEIEKYHLEDAITLKRDETDLTNEVDNYKPKYKINVNGRLETKFNNDKVTVRNKDMER